MPGAAYSVKELWQHFETNEAGESILTRQVGALILTQSPCIGTWCKHPLTQTQRSQILDAGD